MNKQGGVLKILGIVFLVVVIASLIAGVYFYNFYVFKTVRVCLGEANNIMVPCNTNQDCFNILKGQIRKANLSDAPPFVQNELQKVISEATYCNKTCFVRDIRGINLKTQKFEMLNSCTTTESEIKEEINGKRGIELLMWLKERRA